MNKPFDPVLSRVEALGGKIETFGPRPVAPLHVDKSAKQFEFRPFVWRDPSGLPRREWLYPRTYVRKFVTGTVAPGGVGKTGLTLVECLAMATGRDLLGDGYQGAPARVYWWNGEDPYDEMERQVHAAMMHYDIAPEDIDGRFFMDSGHETPIRIAYTEKHGPVVDQAFLDTFTAKAKAQRFDFASFDPFVSIHRVPENSNEGMDTVVKALGRIANEINCAIGIVAHTRKQQAGAGGELSAEDARGGKALVDGARVVRVLNRMSADEAEKAGIVGNAYRRYFWIGSDKINLSPPDAERKWRYLESVILPNGDGGGFGDSMRVVTEWRWPDAFSDVTTADLLQFQTRLNAEPTRNRRSNQSRDWAGHLLAELLELDTAPETKGQTNLSPDQKHARAKCKTILEQWLSSGALIGEAVQDQSRGKMVPIYVVGEWAR